MLGRLQRLVPLLDFLDSLAEVRRRLGDRCVASSAPSNPSVPQQFPCRYSQVRVFLEALHKEVTGSLFPSVSTMRMSLCDGNKDEPETRPLEEADGRH